jgi:fucose 4-O-acetylase-like acetyltransferase
VDVLNAMGFAIILLSGLAVFRTVDRVRLGAILGLLIAFAAPIVSLANWSWLPGLLRTYLVPDSLAFGFFPWGAFVAFGISAGSVIRMVRREQLDRVMQWAALLGLAIIVAARFCGDLPYSLYPTSDFWMNGPWLILIKLGVLLLILAAAYLWTQYGTPQGWSWIRQFGTTSLLVYWVHTELVYGRWLSFCKERLTPPQTAFAALAIILLLLGLSVLKTNWKRLRLPRPAFLSLSYAPRRVPGD